MQRVLEQFAQHKSQQGSLREFVAAHPNLSQSDKLLLIAEEQRLQARETFADFETYVDCLPELTVDSETLMEAVYSEILIREEKGLEVVEEDYIRRFPNHSDSIQRQFQLHRALEKADESLATSDLAKPASKSDAEWTGLLEQLKQDPALEGIELGDICGRGGMGLVIRGVDQQLSREVAVKTIANRVAANSSEAKRMAQEAKAVAKLDHPGIVKIYDVRRSRDGLPILIMEYVAGGNLSTLLAAGPLTPEHACSLMLEIARGVGAAHRNGIVHRDLKPANILLTQSGRPKVADFGLARQVRFAKGMTNQTSFSTTGSLVGTPRYMSPEQAREETKAVTSASDVYALGVIFYEMLTGRPPFQAATAWEVVSDILNEDAAPVRQLNRRVSRDLETICHKCLHKDPQQRYADSDQLADELQRVVDGKPIQARPLGLATRFGKWAARNPATAWLSLSLLVLMLLTTIGSTLAAIELSTANTSIRNEQANTRAAQQQATNDRNAAVQALNDLVTDLYDQLSKSPEATKAQRAVVEAASNGLDQVSRLGDNFALNRSTIVARQRVGDLLMIVGDSEAAEAEYQAALGLAQQQAAAVKDEEANAEQQLLAQSDLARANDMLALHFQKLGVYEQAKMYQDQNRSINLTLVKEHPDRTELLSKLLVSYQREIDFFWQQGQHERALAVSMEAKPYLDKRIQTAGEDPLAYREKSSFFQRLGRAQLQTGDLAAATASYEESLDALERVAELDPDNEAIEQDIAFTQRLAARTYLQSGKVDQALQVINTALATLQRLADLDPENLERSLNVAATLSTRQMIYETQGNNAGMEADLLDAAKIYEANLAIDESRASERALAMHSYFMLGFASFERQDFQACIDWTERVFELDKGFQEQEIARLPDAEIALQTSRMLREMSSRILGTWSAPTTNSASATLSAWLALQDAKAGSIEELSPTTPQRLDSAGLAGPTTISELLAASAEFELAPGLIQLNLARLQTATRIRQAEHAAADEDAPELAAKYLKLALEEYQASCSLSPVMASYLSNDKDCQWLYHTKEFGDAQSSATP